MKMAKASETDISMALDLIGVLDDIERGTFPYLFSDQENEETEWIDTDNREQYDRLIGNLRRLLNRGSVGRVIMGMAVVCDPSNRCIDPDADTLEHHPDLVKASEQRDKLLAALSLIEVDKDGDGFICREAMEQVREAIAQAEGDGA